MNTKVRWGVFFSFQRVKKEFFFVKYSTALTLVINMNVYPHFSIRKYPSGILLKPGLLTCKKKE